MSVFAVLASIDRVVFGLINRAWTHPTLDAVMPVITNIHEVPWFIYGVAPAALCAWLYKGRQRALRVLIVAALAASVCDLIAYRVIKPWAARPRPEYAGIGAVVRGTTGGRLSFPSNHATNMGAAASVLTVASPAAGFAFWSLAGLVAYSRVYCGAHYPFDVLAGLALGGFLSWPWAALMLGATAGGAAKKKRR
jgi:undecaprenyl-diphosphatase